MKRINLLLLALALVVISASSYAASNLKAVAGGGGGGISALTDMPNQAANTVLGNGTSGSAPPTALPMTSCSTAGSAVKWTTDTGFGCNTSITAAVAPISGLTGAGTGVLTALGVNVGSAGAPVLFNGAGGTPSSLTGTNISGTAASLTAGTATALAANGSNCSAGSFPLGVDASGAVESCATVAATQVIRYCFAGSDFNTTTLTAATGVVDEYPPFPSTFTVTDVYAYTRTAPTGTLTIDINEGAGAGTTIMASTKLTIDANETQGGSSGNQGTAATAAVVSDSSIAANAHITADIDSTTGGKGLVVCLIGHF